MNLDQYPNECLRPLIEPFELHVKIQLRAVCTRFKSTVEDICRQRKCLKLLFIRRDQSRLIKKEPWKYCESIPECWDGDGIECWRLKPVGKDDDLVMTEDQFTDDVSDFLAQLFSQLEQLIVWFDESLESVNFPIQTLARFIRSCTSLKSLSLIGKINDTCRLEDELLEVIKQHNSLTELNCPSYPICSEETRRVLLGSQLKRYCFTWGPRWLGTDIGLGFIQTGVGNTHLCLEPVSGKFPQGYLTVILRGLPEKARGVRHLKVKGLSECELLKDIVQHFPLLESFEIAFHHPPMMSLFTGKMVRYLTPLSKLTSLTLRNVNICGYNVKPAKFPYRISSVKRLSISCRDSGSDSFWNKYCAGDFNAQETAQLLAHIFPAVEHLHKPYQSGFDIDHHLGHFKKLRQFHVEEKDPMLALLGRHRDGFMAERDQAERIGNEQIK